MKINKEFIIFTWLSTLTVCLIISAIQIKSQKIEIINSDNAEKVVELIADTTWGNWVNPVPILTSEGLKDRVTTLESIHMETGTIGTYKYTKELNGSYTYTTAYGYGNLHIVGGDSLYSAERLDKMFYKDENRTEKEVLLSIEKLLKEKK